MTSRVHWVLLSLCLLGLLPMAVSAQVEKAQVRIDGMV